MTDPQLLAQARKGNPIAISELLNLSLQPQGIWARVELLDQGIRIVLESPQLPPAAAIAQRLRVGLEKLKPQGLSYVVMQGFELGHIEPTWTQQFHLTPVEQNRPAAMRSPLPITLPAPMAASSHEPATLADSPASEHPTPALVSNNQRLYAYQQSHPSGTRHYSQPFVLKWSDFEPMMLAIIGFVAIYGFLGARNPSYDGPFIWLHYPDLAIHETGHLLFMPFGHFLMVLGGSLTQIAFPAVFTGYFYFTQQYFSSALTLFWTGQNFMDVAVYMADAPYRLLPLTNPNIDAHDWWQLFNMMNCMNQAESIAGITHWIGVLLYLASVIAGVYVAYRHQQKMNQRQRV
ncbi:MAG: hypothetical protein F6K00_19310 [Leptolyngbya sp. SIOISBB]|nr:hypothetical protein [Leptolyngbya sp. SIOISBB]